MQTGIQICKCVEHNGDAINFTYGSDRQRIKEEHYSGGTLQTRTTVVGPHFEKVEEAGSTVYKHYIRAGSKVVAVHDRKSDGQHTTHYLHRDHLGSVDAVSDKDGNIVARMSFDAFGQRRSSLDWNIGFPPGTELDPIRDVTTRGYTGHHMVDAVKLIHMGGRIYDPALGRFLSPDPNIPEPGNTQAYNRYAYVYNNPLSFTDPSGFVTERESPNMTEAEMQEAEAAMTEEQKKELEERVAAGDTVTVEVKYEDGSTGIVTYRPSEATSTTNSGGDIGPASKKSLSEAGTELLKDTEEFRSTPYDDDTGEEINEWVDGATIGYGHLIDEKEWGQYANGITKEQANQLLAADLAVAENAVRANITASVSQNQYDALVILAYNIGPGAFASSSVASMVNNPRARTSFPTLSDAWSAWKYQNCPTNCSNSPGLINRRQAEWNIYSRGVYEQW